MDGFLKILEDAAKASAIECRKIAKDVLNNVGVDTHNYGRESEATFKAILYWKLKEKFGVKTLGLEPGKPYGHVDLVYCPTGVKYSKKDVDEMSLIEVKCVSLQKNKPDLYAGEGIEGDIEKLVDLKEKNFHKASLVMIVVLDGQNVSIDGNHKTRPDEKIYSDTLKMLLRKKSKGENIKLITC